MKDNRHRDYTHFFCICCGTPTTQLGMGMDESITDRKHKLESGMYRNAVVDSIAAGYGSSHDTDIYYIAVCDDCTTEALEDGRLAYKSNYMSMRPIKEDIEKWDAGYDKRLRDVNIDDLLK